MNARGPSFASSVVTLSVGSRFQYGLQPLIRYRDFWPVCFTHPDDGADAVEDDGVEVEWVGEEP